MTETNISDFEIRVIGEPHTNSNQSTGGGNRHPWQRRMLAIVGAIIACALVIFGAVVWRDHQRKTDDYQAESVFEQAPPAKVSHPLRQWLGSLDSISKVATAVKDTTVNDIPLRLFVPLNSVPHLEVGYSVTDHREKSILFFQAADVRADNKKIVGAFVLAGKPLSWGLSKRGYCSIIGDKVTVGVAENSPLFEEATETNGFFFRQFPLVDKGALVESEQKNKSMRRAICDIEGKVMIAQSLTDESMHDFAQALVDIGTDNAIYLVGGYAIGWCYDLEGNGRKMGLWDERVYKNVSFIVWPAEEK